MFILDKPYVSDFLLNTALKNSNDSGFAVFDASPEKDSGAGNFCGLNLLDEESALYKAKKGDKIYTNSENALSWVLENLKDNEISSLINICKDKALFRRTISNIYPGFYFKECTLENLFSLETSNIKFPVVLKPAVGFLSFGVYVIDNAPEWQNNLNGLKCDIKKFEKIFPKSVVNTSNFIIEQMIEGEEYAADVYFDADSKPVILNVFKHPFSGGKDVSDKIYYTSSEILSSSLDRFSNLFEKIAASSGFKNFPCHIELRQNGDTIIPIEINPMRFAGWCLCDLAYYAWGINVYEYYFNNKKPNWEKILNTKDKSLYSFIIAALPEGVKKGEIKEIDYPGLKKCVQNPLELRKIDYKKHPLFGVLFTKSKDYSEVEKILKLDFSQYVKL